MCRGILDDKTIKLEMMNNINMTQQVETGQQQAQPPPQLSGGGDDERLPEKVLEMYNMLLGITTELEKIKYQLAKRPSVPPSDGEEAKEAIMLCHFRKQKLCCSKCGRRDEIFF